MKHAFRDDDILHERELVCLISPDELKDRLQVVQGICLEDDQISQAIAIVISIVEVLGVGYWSTIVDEVAQRSDVICQSFVDIEDQNIGDACFVIQQANVPHNADQRRIDCIYAVDLGNLKNLLKLAGEVEAAEGNHLNGRKLGIRIEEHEMEWPQIFEGRNQHGLQLYIIGGKRAPQLVILPILVPDVDIDELFGEAERGWFC